MSKAYGAHNHNMVRQGRHSPQEVVSAIREIARVSEGLMEINSHMNNLTGLANLFSERAIEVVHTGDADNKNLALAAHEAHKLAEFSSEQSRAIGSMFTEIRGPIDKINCSIDKVLSNLKVIDRE